MATQSKITIQIDNDVIELSGAQEEAFLADRNLIKIEMDKSKAEADAKAAARVALLNRLGITEEEAKLLA